MSHLSDYMNHWVEPFPEGKQRIYMIGGNTNASDSSLDLQYEFPKEYDNWCSVMEWILEDSKKEDDRMFSWENVNSTYNEEDPDEYSFVHDVENLSNPTSVFSLITKQTYDPVFLVRGSNPLFQWLHEIRNYF